MEGKLNMWLDKLFTKQYDWITLKSQDVDQLIEIANVYMYPKGNYRVYRCVDTNEWPMKLILYHPKDDNWN